VAVQTRPELRRQHFHFTCESEKGIDRGEASVSYRCAWIFLQLRAFVLLLLLNYTWLVSLLTSKLHRHKEETLIFLNSLPWFSMKSIIERYSKQKEECQPLVNPASEVKVSTQQTLILLCEIYSMHRGTSTQVIAFLLEGSCQWLSGHSEKASRFISSFMVFHHPHVWTCFWLKRKNAKNLASTDNKAAGSTNIA